MNAAKKKPTGKRMLRVRMTGDEWAELERRAAEAGLGDNLSAYVRLVACGSESVG